MIELQNLSYRVGSFVLEELSHRFAAEQFHIVLGPSGSGKSLLLELLAGLLPPHSGSIHLDGHNCTHWSPEKRLVGYLPQDNVLFPHLNVQQNIAYALQVQRRYDPALVQSIAQSLHIGHLLTRPVLGLSGGEVQRVALARSLAAGSKLLLLDEPTSALHQGLRNELCYLLRSIQQQFRLTVLMVTHDIESAFLLGDTITFLIDGKVRQHYHATEGLFVPQQRAVAQFLGMHNCFELQATEQAQQFWSPALQQMVQLTAELSAAAPATAPFTVGIAAEDVRLVLPGREAEYLHSPNRWLGRVEQVFRRAFAYSLFLSLPRSTSTVEVLFPITKAHKIDFAAGDSIWIVCHPERFFRLL